MFQQRLSIDNLPFEKHEMVVKSRENIGTFSYHRIVETLEPLAIVLINAMKQRYVPHVSLHNQIHIGYPWWLPFCRHCSEWKKNIVGLFTRGQLWPSGIVVACVCLCVRPSVCQPLACPRDNSSPVQVRVLGGDWPWSSRSNLTLKSKFTPFELVRGKTHHSFKLGAPNLDQRYKIPCLRFLFFGGLIERERSNLTDFQNPVYLRRFFASSKYLWDMQTAEFVEWDRSGRRFGNLRSILQAAISFHQIIHTSHAEITYASIRQLSKQEENSVHLP